MTDIEIRAVVDGAKGKHIIDLFTFDITETLTFSSGELRDITLPANQFKQLEIEKDIRIEIKDGAKWKELWDGYLFNPELVLSGTEVVAKALGRSHTAKLLNTYIDSDYYFDTPSYIARALMEDNGHKATSINKNEGAFINTDFSMSSSIDMFSEETDGSWEHDSANEVYSGNDGGLDKTIFNGFTDDGTGFLMRFTPSAQSGTVYGAVFRYIDSNNYYYLDVQGGALYCVTGGVADLLTTLQLTTAGNGKVCRIWMSGSEGAITVDNTAPSYFWNGDHATGQCGLFVNNAHVHFDNFSVYPERHTVKHLTPTRVTILKAVQELRLLSFNANSGGADFSFDRNNNLTWKYRDLNEPTIMDLVEGENIIGGRVFRDYDAVRNKVSVYGSSGAFEIPLAPDGDYFTRGNWLDDGGWGTFTDQAIKISTVLTGVASAEAWYPYTFATDVLDIDTTIYDEVVCTLERLSANTGWVWNFHGHGTGGLDTLFSASPGSLPTGVPTEFTGTFSNVTTLNYFRIAVNAQSGGQVCSVHISDITLRNSGDASDFLVLKTDSDTPFSDTREYEETNTSISTINGAKDYVNALLELKKLARWKGNVVVEGNRLLKAGRNVRIVIPSAGFNQIMRISEVNHSNSGGEYITTIQLDEPTAILVNELGAIKGNMTEARNRDIPDDIATITL